MKALLLPVKFRPGPWHPGRQTMFQFIRTSSAKALPCVPERHYCAPRPIVECAATDQLLIPITFEKQGKAD